MDKRIAPPRRYKQINVNGRVMLLHRYLVELLLERPLQPDEVVHHINNDPQDNRYLNLQLLTYKEHARLHSHTNPTLFKIGHRDADPRIAARRKQIETLALQGLSFGKIAKIIGVHRGTVQHYLRREQVRQSKQRRRDAAAFNNGDEA